MPSIRLSDIGTIFRLTVKDNGTVVNVSATTSRQIIFQKPNGTSLTKTAVFTTDGSDGDIEYKSVTGDIDAAGQWFLQARLVFAATDDFRSSLANFDVKSDL